MKNILGLDLGTNSIGWALVCIDDEQRLVTIRAIGSRIIPMNEGDLSTFAEGGKVKSSASSKTSKKAARKLYYRFAIRRDRLNCVLELLGMLPTHYRIELFNEKGIRTGKSLDKDAKIAYYKNENGKWEFLFKESYNEMVAEFKEVHPELFVNKRGGSISVPQDWTLFYLRKKAQYEEVSPEELAWIIMSYNQRRGYEPVSGTEQSAGENNKVVEDFTLQVATEPCIIEKNSVGSKTKGYKNADGDIYRIDLCNPILENSSDIVYSYYLQGAELPHKGDTIMITCTTIVEEGEVDESMTTYTLTEVIDVEGETKLRKTIFAPDGSLKRKVSIVKMDESDWKALKAKKESEIEKYNHEHDTIGIAEYTYACLLENPSIKIHGELYATVEREFYREELKRIIENQSKYHEALSTPEIYNRIVDVLYPHNPSHHDSALKQSIWEFITEDVIEYQRDLKSKKSEIADCRYERDGSADNRPLKAAHKFNPYYQEFRLWKFLSHVHIFCNEATDENGNSIYNQDVTDAKLPKEKRSEVYTKMRVRKSFNQKQFLKLLDLNDSEYHWNYESDFEVKGDETHYEFLWRLKRVAGWNQSMAEKFLSSQKGGQSVEYMLWHLFYSVKKVKVLHKALLKLLRKSLGIAGLPDTDLDPIFNRLITFEGYTNDYGAYSEKAIKKILPLMRCGTYWQQSDVEKLTLHTLSDKLCADEGINGEIRDFQGLHEHTCCYLLYNRYSEVGDAQKWNTPNDIKDYLRNEFKQGEMRNPIVEQVIRETLNVVHDIWTCYGEKDTEGHILPLFDKINIELARELKKTPEQKTKETDRNKKNRAANRHAYEMLKELKTMYDGIEPKSPRQQMKMRIYEDTVWQDSKLNAESFQAIDKEGNELGLTYETACKCRYSITQKELKKYILWLEQKYVSPYTGKVISLANLFDGDKYQIEHVLPQERVTLNAMYNLVLCEAEVNKEKSNLTAMEFIRQRHGDEIEILWNHEKVKVRSEQEYKEYVQTTYHNNKKKQILLSADIPAEFTNSQLNNTQHISRVVMKLMSNIVRDTEDPEDMVSYRSKNVLAISGGVTSVLKHDWELDNTWNELIKNRFLRLNQLTNSEMFGKVRDVHGKQVFVPDVPECLKFDFEKKRIDHRHHAMDALVAALTTEVHVNYINNMNAGKQDRQDIVAKYRCKNEQKSRSFRKPMWYKAGEELIKYSYCYGENHASENFSKIVLLALQDIVVTFKQKDYHNIIRKRKNFYKAWDETQNAIITKKEDCLEDRTKFSVRTSLHEETLYGKRATMPCPLEKALENPTTIQSRVIRQLCTQAKNSGLSKVCDVLSYIKSNLRPEAFEKYQVVSIVKDSVKSRFKHTIESLCEKSTNKEVRLKNCIDKIQKIMDIRIQEILIDHLRVHGNDPKLAFSSKGIFELNSSIEQRYHHKPIKRFSVATSFTGRPINTSAPNVKSRQYVTTAGGNNLVVGIYSSESDRKFYVPNLIDTIQSLRNNEEPTPCLHPDYEAYTKVFDLQVNDIVYVPTLQDIERGKIAYIDPLRIYRLTNFSGQQLNFVPSYMASQIITVDDKKEQTEGSDSANNTKIKVFYDKAVQGEEKHFTHDLLSELVVSRNRGFKESTMSFEGDNYSLYQEKTMVKSVCWKLEVDRLGNITKIEK